MVNKLILVGNVGKNPEIHHLEGGTAVARFSLATSEVWKDKAGEKHQETQWHAITAWRQLAELAEKYITKGMQLYVEGKVTYRTYDDKDGNKRYTTEIIAQEIRFLGSKPKSENDARSDESPETGADQMPEGDDLPF